MDHVGVVDELPEEWSGTRFRFRCETCPYATATKTEDAAYRFAENHFDDARDRARAAELLAKIETRHGDTIVVTLFDGADPSIVLTVDDVDATSMPSVELSIDDAVELREALRAQLEEAARPRGAWRWTRRR